MAKAFRAGLKSLAGLIALSPFIVLVLAGIGAITLRVNGWDGALMAAGLLAAPVAIGAALWWSATRIR